ncbi:hypothetical protein LCGC14_1020820 [marine sediment metagenome]|uniref:Uncharacterized protein n=1 Tax=marine sediment metagenome TaxID=412755 RepID=A0A0F9N206_9ZZZZ
METTFANTPRIKNKAFSKQVGENLLERDNDGHVSWSFGFFSPSQVFARKVSAQAISARVFKEFVSKSYYSRILKEL